MIKYYHPKIKYINIVAFSILIIALLSVSGPILWSTGVQILSLTYITWFLNVFILLIWFKSIKYYVNTDQIKLMRSLKLLLLWFLFSIFRGAFAADDYWTTKMLIHHTFGLLLPVVAYVLTNTKVLQTLLRSYVKYALPLFLFIMFFLPTDFYGHYLLLVSVILVFFPVLRTRVKFYN